MRWISPIIMRLLVTLKPRKAESRGLTFFPFFFPLRPPCAPSVESEVAPAAPWDSGGGAGFLALLFNMSMNFVSDMSASLEDEVRRKWPSLPDAGISEWEPKSCLPPESYERVSSRITYLRKMFWVVERARIFTDRMVQWINNAIIINMKKGTRWEAHPNPEKCSLKPYN